MTDQTFHQLRFDICENVRLHTQQPSIKELLELDLYPDVEIKDKGNHLKIEGFLRLKGAYQSGEESEGDSFEGEDRREELSYIIPVEITLPADRAELDHISAEIESFDYQVLSPFELQIDAILLIDGLIPEKQGEESVDEQEIPMFSGSEASIETSSSERAESVNEEEATIPDQKESMEVDDHPMPEKDDRASAEKIEAFPEESEVDHSLTEEVEELRSDEDEPVSETEDEIEQNQVSMDEQLDEEIDHNKEDWAQWLLGEKEENFTSMRMVIVQENDSVQEIAERYDISPSQIRQLNHLDDRELEKGQIIYIPNEDEKGTSSQP